MLKNYNDFKVFIEYSNDKHDVYEYFDECNKYKQ